MSGTCPATLVICDPSALKAPEAVAPKPRILAPTCVTMPRNPPTSLMAVLNPSRAPRPNCLMPSPTRRKMLTFFSAVVASSFDATAARFSSSTNASTLSVRLPVAPLSVVVPLAASFAALSSSAYPAVACSTLASNSPRSMSYWTTTLASAMLLSGSFYPLLFG